MFPITTLTAGGPELPGNGSRPTPDQLRYLQRLIGPLLEGRALAKVYDGILLAILAVLTIRHIIKTKQNRRKHRALKQQQQKSNQIIDEDDSTAQSSSSSSTLQGSASPSGSSITKPPPSHLDIERQPLLSNNTQTPSSSSPRSLLSSPSLLRRAHHTLRAWLIYQPPPIPLLNKPLPSNSTSLLIILYLALNLLILLLHTPTSPSLLFAPADRAGLLFTTNLPLLYLLSAKNQPLKPLTGLSYETLNILHRRVGELLCLLALLHGLGIIIWVRATAPAWLQSRFDNFFQTYLVIDGLIALAAYEMLYLTSLASFRKRWYEAFLASHVVLQVVGLGMLWLHQKSAARPYVAAALVIFCCDRLVWRLCFKSVRLENVELAVLEDGETVRVSTDWDIVASSPSSKHGGAWGWGRFWWRSVVGQDIKSGGWRPADHVFLSVDGLGAGARLQAHPFTIASAAPEPRVSPWDDDGAALEGTRHAWFSLLIRAQGDDGFTSALLRHARLHRSVSIRVDGPYGSHAPLDMLRGREVNVLVAGGSGIAVIFPLAWSLARENSISAGKMEGRRRIYLMWVVHSALHHESWIPAERMQELKEMGVQVTLPGPTVVEGRPDVAGYIRDVVSGEDKDQIGVVVSGPDGLNRSVRNACSRAVGEGRDVKVSVEKFGW